MINSDTSVLIIGAGTFGLSTALELLRKGHQNVTLLDPYKVPSPLSAGNDVNKIFQSTVENAFYSDLAREALEMWRSDPVYKPAFHEVGIVYGACGDNAITEINRRVSFLKEKNVKFLELSSPEEFANFVKTPSVKLDNSISNLSLNDRFENWRGYFQQEMCGWTFAALALDNAARECEKLGAEFRIGLAEELLFEGDKCTGVRTSIGEIIDADITVICAGAQSCKLLDFGGQLLAKCWTVGHIRLTDEEASTLRGSPVVLNLDQGFIFEPDMNNDLKFCNEFPGYINMVEEKGTSIPVFRNQIPVEAEKQMRNFLKQVYPIIAERPFSVAKICWCTDTPDRHFLFTEHPKYNNLVLGTGDSGQGFKFMPVVGKYISQIVMEGSSTLDNSKAKAWKWRQEQGQQRDNLATQGRYGGLNLIRDLKDVDSWTSAK
ncbi:hypothetical protein PICMEDRAFT_17102 [Pichia membranifaciens NRRL Y-2026]|uniref:FAD dependent oxidoreductase domain-containing protein n=1 Tax=Pichia membranifaciens NRRL Y-2026 TaxID=763406 RepID=A0A1E3NJU3_9ASCO|nr:hypothetical protein PICMEDRAFT_17102 [Pichia membranifaciens NRRL Y-2026]ODQ45838.1 hypothetical protein PICMEDRAFT_17102 [Pichia membranifaciens NRRL Y-2026]